MSLYAFSKTIGETGPAPAIHAVSAPNSLFGILCIYLFLDVETSYEFNVVAPARPACVLSIALCRETLEGLTLYLGIGFRLLHMLGLTIGELAQKAGIAVETVRFYERKGLIADPPRRPSSGYREYPVDTVRRLRFIRRAKELGFSLREVEELLALRTSSSASCGEVREQVASKLDDVQERIDDLRRMERALSRLHALCESTDPLGDCPILDLLEEPTGD